MRISAICCTFARYERLRESLACFMAQTYTDRELIVYNTNPRQTYVCDLPGVKVINCTERPASLGQARNEAVKFATGGIIVTWDDDDLFLPDHLNNVVSLFERNPECYWLHVRPTFAAHEWKIKETISSWMNSVAFRRGAFEAVGGYPKLNVGEDAAFLSALSSKLPGRVITTPIQAITSIYCWGNNVYHISGQGPDAIGKMSAIRRMERDAFQRMQQGKEPTGEIRLTPHMDPAHDPRTMAQEYLRNRAAQPTDEDVCVVMLGRYGDIVNILPILLHIHNRYRTPYVMVSREFADIFDGVSYVKPYPVDLTNDKLHEALQLAQREFKLVMNAQIWGKGWLQERTTSAYNIESWKSMGFMREFFDVGEQWKPYFDKLDKERGDAVLVKLWGRSNKPYIVVNLTHAVSSPFRHGATILQWIREKYSDEYEIFDVGGLKLERIFDLITVLRNASAIVTCDSSLLHLAAATGKPVLPFVNPAPWQGSLPRCLCPAGVFKYSDRLPNDRSTVYDAMDAVLHFSDTLLYQDGADVITAPTRTIFHAVELHEEKDLKEMGRKAMAQESWAPLYAKGVIPVYYRKYLRDAREIGDKRDLPYLKDVLRYAMDKAGPYDIVMFSNDDNWLHPDLPEIVRLHCALWGAVCSQRCEFKAKPFPVGHPPTEFAKQGERHMGRDIFAFTVEWLHNHWQDIPDFILGASDWDLCMAAMIRLRWGIETTRKNLEDIMWPAELPRGYVSHKYHPPKWNADDNVKTAPSQIHNRKLFREWAQIWLPSLKFTPENTI